MCPDLTKPSLARTLKTLSASPRFTWITVSDLVKAIHPPLSMELEPNRGMELDILPSLPWLRQKYILLLPSSATYNFSNNTTGAAADINWRQAPLFKMIIEKRGRCSILVLNLYTVET
jgi:hypothetical protein